jgi:hypothetical protein
MNYGHMFMPTSPMGMQSNQNQNPAAPMAAPPSPMGGGMPPWAQQMGPGMGPNAAPPPMGQPPAMGNGAAAMAPPMNNPINTQVNAMQGSPGMGGPPAAGNMGGYMQAAQMGLGMLQKGEGDAQQVIQQRQQMNQQGMDRMQQLAAIMRQRSMQG